MTGTLLPGVFGAGAARLDDNTRLECGICWTVYDPAQGCVEWDIAPGTPFTALPDHWRCPTCDNERSVFLPLDTAPHPMASRVAALEDAFRRAEGAMRDTPFHNPALRVEAVGFQAWGDHLWLGILITPWFMHAVLLPCDAAAWDDLVPGAAKHPHRLPAGRFDFELGRLDGFGMWQGCSLFSPMNDFGDHDSARLTALAALDALLTPEEEEPKPEPPAVNRRDLLRGRLGETP